MVDQNEFFLFQQDILIDIDTFVVNGKKITISNSIGIDYDEFTERYRYPEETMFVVSYYILSNYDPDYKTDEVEV